MVLKESQFRTHLDETHAPTVAYFFADWCGPCKKFSPVFEGAAGKAGKGITFAKLNIDECTQLVQDLNISAVPTIILFKNSKVIARHTGPFPTQLALEQFIKKSL